MNKEFAQSLLEAYTFQSTGMSSAIVIELCKNTTLDEKVINKMNHMNNASDLRIGELAAEQGLNSKTIRYYEEIGLLPLAKRGENGYRLYDDADRERLHFIAKAKAVGLTLEEIGEILALQGKGTQPCEHVLEILDHKLMIVEEQMRALSDFRQELLSLHEEAGKTMRTDACVCGIIEQHRQTPGSTAELPLHTASNRERLSTGLLQPKRRRRHNHPALSASSA